MEHWIDQLQKIDSVLQEPIESLINIVRWNVAQESHPFAGLVGKPVYFPAWVAEERQFKAPSSVNLATAQCVKTLQRVWNERRRFPRALRKSIDKLEEILETPDVVGTLANAFVPVCGPDGVVNYGEHIRNVDLMGDWFPYSTAQILWVLIQGGEKSTYSSTTALCLFAMLWSMHGSESGTGASIGMLPASAYVTHHCVSAIETLRSACEQRAKVVCDIVEIITKIDGETAQASTSPMLPLDLDHLLGLLHDYAENSIIREEFLGTIGEVEALLDPLTVTSESSEVWATVRNMLHRGLKEFAVRGTALLDRLKGVVEVMDQICYAINPDEGQEPNETREQQNARIDRIEAAAGKTLAGLGVAHPLPAFTRDSAERHRYWHEYHLAAEQARNACADLINHFRDSVDACGKSTGPDGTGLVAGFTAIATTNQRLAERLASAVKKAEQWCATVVVTREIANASSGNTTEFAPAELAAGLAVGVQSGLIESKQIISAAVRKIIDALQSGGVWFSGQPFFLDETYSRGTWPATSDIIWMVVRSLRDFESLTEVDDSLSDFLDWLQLKRLRFTISEIASRPLRDKQEFLGWVSERQVQPARIDLWSTAYAINALIELRGLVELRLWSLCRSRFTIIDDALPLREVMATDLGSPHGQRIHQTLARMSREAASDDYESANYSLILHGPPGSSKTLIANAVARMMWKGSRRHWGTSIRMIRITPADFTRRGEAQIDFEARVIFKLLTNLRGVTILFDEIDDLLRQRRIEEPPSFLKIVVPAMLNRLQDLRDACPRQQICFLIATNYIDNIEPALIRKGRIDNTIPLVYPDRESRSVTIRQELPEELAQALIAKGMKETDFWPYSILRKACGSLKARLKTSQPSQREVDLAISGVLSDHRTASTPPYSHPRIRSIPNNEGLRKEYFTYLMSGADDLNEFLQQARNRLASAYGSEPVPQDLLEEAEILWSRKRTK